MPLSVIVANHPSGSSGLLVTITRCFRFWTVIPTTKTFISCPHINVLHCLPPNHTLQRTCCKRISLPRHSVLARSLKSTFDTSCSSVRCTGIGATSPAPQTNFPTLRASGREAAHWFRPRVIAPLFWSHCRQLLIAHLFFPIFIIVISHFYSPIKVGVEPIIPAGRAKSRPPLNSSVMLHSSSTGR